MQLLNEYFELQRKIYEYFRYKEDWVVIPLDDATEYYWYLEQYESGYGQVYFWKDYYGDEIYTQRFLPKWVYVGEEYTMISVDTHTDGNKFLRVFSNKLKVDEPPDWIGE